MSAMLAGWAQPHSAPLPGFVEASGPATSAGVIGSVLRTSAPTAAHVNALLATETELDDVFPCVAHLGAITTAVALAIGEDRHLSGKDVIASAAAGFEAGARFGSSMGVPVYDDADQAYRGVRRSYTVAGVIAAAATAARALGLDTERTRWAIGIGGSNSTIPSGAGRWAAAGADQRMFAINDLGWSAKTGVEAALLAESGVAAFAGILDGPRSLAPMAGSPIYDSDLITRDLGTRWFMMDDVFKPWPFERFVQYPMWLLDRLMYEQGLSARDIDRLTMRPIPFVTGAGVPGTGPGTATVIGGVQHAAAMIALRTPLHPSWRSPQIVADPRVQEFAARVEVEPEHAAREASRHNRDGQYRLMPSSIEVSARGQTFTAYTEVCKGDPWTEDTYFTDDELKEKFRSLARPLHAGVDGWPRAVENGVELVLGLEHVADVREVTASLEPTRVV